MSEPVLMAVFWAFVVLGTGAGVAAIVSHSWRLLVASWGIYGAAALMLLAGLAYHA